MQGRSEEQRELLDVESVAGHLLPVGSVFAFLAERRRALFPDVMFADLFPSGRGRPSVPADVVATVLVLPALHHSSDREAAEAVTFDPTTLTYWRRRLAASEQPNRIFDAVKAVVAETGVLRGKSRRGLDSTIRHDAVATQDTVTQLIGAVRRVRRDVPGATEVVAQRCRAHDYDDPGKPRIVWNDPAARDALVDALVRDAHTLLDAVGEQGGRWRIAQRVAKDRVISTVDPEARHAHKTLHRRQDGLKAHVAVEPDTGLVTDCTLTKASGPGSPGRRGRDRPTHRHDRVLRGPRRQRLRHRREAPR